MNEWALKQEKKICWKSRETFSLQSAKWKKLDFYTWRKIFRKISREISKIEWDINKSAKGAIEIYIFSVKTSISPSRSLSNFFFVVFDVSCNIKTISDLSFFQLSFAVFSCLKIPIKMYIEINFPHITHCSEAC